MAGTSGSEAVNPFFVAWAEFVLRFRWPLLAITIVSTIAAAWFIANNIRMDNSVEAFTASDSIDTHLLEQFRDEFGRDDLFILLIEGDVFSKSYLDRLKKLHDEVAAMDLPLKSLGKRSKRYAAWKAKVAAEEAAKGTRPAPAPPPPAPPPPASMADPPAEASAASVGDMGGDDDFAGGDDFDSGDGAAGDDDFGDFEDDTSAGGASGDSGEAATTGDGGADGSATGADDGWGDEKGGSVVDEVISLINVRRTKADGDGIEVGKWFDPMPAEAEIAALKKLVLADRTLVGQVVSDGAKHSVLLIRTQFMSEEDNALVWKTLRDMGQRHETEDFKILVAGPPALGSALNDLMLTGFQRLMSLSLVLMFVLMVLLFRHPFGVIGPMGVVVMATLGTMGAMAAMDWPLTMLSLIVPSFLVCVGIGDSVHLQVVYRQERLAGLGNHEAIVRSMGTTGIPVLFTTLTTMIGLLSFQFAATDAIREMGTSGAMGVALALLHSLVYLPIILSFNTKSLLGARRFEDKADFIERVLGWATRFSKDEGAPHGCLDRKTTPRRFRAVIVMGLITMASVAGASQLRVYHNPVSWIPEGFPTRDAFDGLDEHLAGTASVSVMFDAKKPGGIKSLELLKAMERFEEHIRRFEHPNFPPGTRFIGSTMSLLDVVKETNRALHAGDEKFYRLPDTDRGVSDLMFMFENASPDQLKRLVTNDMRKTHMTLRVRWVDATSYGPLIEHIEVGVDKYFRAAKIDADVITTGAVYSIFSVISMIVFDLLKSFGVAFVVITLLLIVMLRSLKLGLIGMVPNLLPIAAIMGVMGAMDIPIDMVNLLIASIAIGIAVDDTIHYLHHFHTHYQLNGKVQDAIQYTKMHSGRAMMSTSTILVIGFAVFLYSQMANVRRFGGLVSLTVIFALLIDIVFTPALLRVFYRDRTPADSSAGPASAQPPQEAA